MKNNSARDRIINTAIKLFNEQGAMTVTTSQIADIAMVSPGTLYYHFRSKNEIVYAIMDKILEYDTVLDDTIANFSKDDLTIYFSEFLKILHEHNWRFRFFKRDMIALSVDDPELAYRYGKFQQSRINFLVDFVTSGIKFNLFNPMPQKSIQFLANQLWLNAHFWNAVLVSRNIRITRKTIQEVENNIYHMFLPYFSKPVESFAKKRLFDK